MKGEKPMPERFGDLLRKQRHKANKTLGDIARLLGLSVVFLSDVERGNRKPLSNERLVKIADFLGQDPTPLIEAADLERGFIEYDIRKARPLEADVVGGLVAGLARGGVTDEQLHDIQEILKGGQNADE
jgi:transcriptional regulator with XRE-family HTH domain